MAALGFPGIWLTYCTCIKDSTSKYSLQDRNYVAV